MLCTNSPFTLFRPCRKWKNLAKLSLQGKLTAYLHVCDTSPKYLPISFLLTSQERSKHHPPTSSPTPPVCPTDILEDIQPAHLGLPSPYELTPISLAQTKLPQTPQLFVLWTRILSLEGALCTFQET